MIAARRTILALSLIVAVGVAAPKGEAVSPAPAATPTPTVAQPDGNVMAAQSYLANYGYSTRPTGFYDTVTTRAVKHFQRANGLPVDGIVGLAVMRAMGLPTSSPATPAPSTTAPATAPVVVPAGAWKCPASVALLAQYGLPVGYFDRVMYRESRCDPTAYNGRGRDRSYGLLQINTKGANWGELQRRCGLTSRDQLFDARTNIACAAQLYKVYGKKPWGG